jgi:hypothetical protein
MRFALTIDSLDPSRIVPFWSEALGYTSAGQFGVFCPLFLADDREPPILIQRVGEPSEIVGGRQ